MHCPGPPPFPYYRRRYVTGLRQGNLVYGRHYTRLVPRTWDAALRASGYRVTPQRQLVLEAVTRLEHATPDEIYAEVKRHAVGLNVSTVYRTLELLEQIGLVTHTHLGHGAHRYHLATDPQHLHLVCRACGGIIELDPEVAAPLVDRLEADYGFVTDVGHLTVFGTCSACRS